MSNTYKLLRVNLTAGTIKIEEIPEATVAAYLGGSGLGAKILYEETDEHTEPLSEDNKLIFAVGVLTGSKFFNSNRFQVVSKSPLTGIYGEGNCGGYWGEALQKSGYIAVIIEGKAASPVYLYIDEHSADIKDARLLWGKDTFFTDTQLKKIHGEDAQIASIGIGGENLVKYACITTDGTHARSIGRCGLGAVMGSKLLKSVVANGHEETSLHDELKIRQVMKGLAEKYKGGIIPNLRKYGTSAGTSGSQEIGNLPIRNWGGTNWPEGAAKISGIVMEENFLSGRYKCGRCVFQCGRSVHSQSGLDGDIEVGGPEYETVGLLGSNLLIDDLKTVLIANELCNRYGLDTISTGNSIGFAFEAYEKGFLSESDLGGLTLQWGSADSVLKAIDAIAKREGIGNLLAEGVRIMARRLGPKTEEFAVHVKGLEPPAHDPRAKTSTALSFGTSNRGACHLQAFTSDFDEALVIEDLGVAFPDDRLAYDGKAIFVKKMQDLMCVYDSLSVCKFLLFGLTTVHELNDVINATTGWDNSVEELLHVGERIFNLKRMYNVREGISRKDDCIPPRMLKNIHYHDRDELQGYEMMLEEYYELRGWDEQGIPRSETLKKLNLEDLTRI